MPLDPVWIEALYPSSIQVEVVSESVLPAIWSTDFSVTREIGDKWLRNDEQRCSTFRAWSFQTLEIACLIPLISIPHKLLCMSIASPLTSGWNRSSDMPSLIAKKLLLRV